MLTRLTRPHAPELLRFRGDLEGGESNLAAASVRQKTAYIFILY